MKVLTTLGDVAIERSCVAIGVFDGVHRGHRKVLEAASAAAAELGCESVALTFDRLPADLLAPQKAPPYLTTLSQKIEMIEQTRSVDTLIVAPFNLEFASLNSHQFVDKVLVSRLGAKAVRVGADFRYGRGRQSGVMELEAAGLRFGFEVAVVHAIAEDGQRVSSTHIRSLVGSGKVELAARHLGHHFALRGEVAYGKQLGRTIGFPTANLRLDEPRQALPAVGVYAGWVVVRSDFDRASERIPASISIGTNPTTDGAGAEIKIEAHLMDGFDANIYGAKIDILFETRIRGIRKFDSLDALTQQIHKDVRQAESVLGQGERALS